MYRWDVFSAACSLCALVLTLLGTIFPYWWIVNEHDSDGVEWTFHYGIWVTITCEQHSCVTQPSQMKGDRVFLVLSAACYLCALVLTLLGTIFPYWWIVNEHDSNGVEWTFHYGIWVTITCEQHSCVTQPSQMKGDRAWLLGPAVLMVFANSVLFLSTLCNLVYLFTDKFEKTLRRLAIVFCCGTGGTIILSVLIFYKKKAGLRPSAAPETTDGDPEWALLLATFGGVLAVINSFFIGIGFKRRSDDQKREDRVFGMKNVADFEIDVNALRKGVFIHGANITRINSEKDNLNLKDQSVDIEKGTKGTKESKQELTRKSSFRKSAPLNTNGKVSFQTETVHI